MDGLTCARYLADGWTTVTKGKVAPNACVLAGRVATEVFTYFGVRHRLLPVGVAALNDRALVEIEAGRPIDEWPDEAWSVGVGKGAVVADVPGWAGHLVAVVEGNVFVDLTAEQLDRPFQALEVGGPLVVDGTEFEIVSYPGLFSGMAIDVKQGRYVWWPEPDNVSYRRVRDWRVHGKKFAGPVIRYIRGRRESVVPGS
jgi:hypothetical protein